MISNLSLNQFSGIPYLAGSALMQHHGGNLRFSSTKPNVIVGPNGAGKSALLTTLALRFLAYWTGASAFDNKYVMDSEAAAWWTREREWGNEYTWLKGLDCKTDNGPVLYFRPGHVPGNEKCITTAMMVGYFDEAKAYGRMVDEKSSGQQSQALQARVHAALAGEKLPEGYGADRWRFGREPVSFDHRGFVGSYDHQAEVLKSFYRPAADAIPLILMDEPEQSLDARAEAQLWKSLAAADCSKMQVIVATHSLYPLLHPKKFNLIEAEEGFANEVVSLTC